MDQTLFDRDLLITRFESEDMVDRLAVVFIENTLQTIQEIETALQQEDYQAIANLAHRLKGSALSFCSDKVHNLADDVEIAVKTTPINHNVLDHKVEKLAQLCH